VRLPPFPSLNHPAYPASNRRHSIQKNPHEPTFFTNRALTRLRLSHWSGADNDARAALALYGPKSPSRLKPSAYLTQALLGRQHPHEAYDVAIDAYRASLAAKSPQTENLSRLVLRAKQAIWAGKETGRLRAMDESLAAVEGLIEAELERALQGLESRQENGEIGAVGAGEDAAALREEAGRNVGNVREAFRVASRGEVQERVRIYLLPHRFLLGDG
jgi:STIP1 family protein 1